LIYKLLFDYYIIKFERR